jgi:hypothetical protein
MEEVRQSAPRPTEGLLKRGSYSAFDPHSTLNRIDSRGGSARTPCWRVDVKRLPVLPDVRPQPSLQFNGLANKPNGSLCGCFARSEPLSLEVQRPSKKNKAW